MNTSDLKLSRRTKGAWRWRFEGLPTFASVKNKPHIQCPMVVAAVVLREAVIIKKMMGPCHRSRVVFLSSSDDGTNPLIDEKLRKRIARYYKMKGQNADL
jgi:hypothetical protein